MATPLYVKFKWVVCNLSISQILLRTTLFAESQIRTKRADSEEDTASETNKRCFQGLSSSPCLYTIWLPTTAKIWPMVGKSVLTNVRTPGCTRLHFFDSA